MKADLVRSYFDSIVNMLELITDKKITVVVERLNSDNLKLEFDNIKFVLFAKLNELDLIKLRISSESETCDIIAEDRTIDDERIKERLSCNICLKYNVPSLCGLPGAKPFQCLHCFHPQCVTNWKAWRLTIGNRSGPLNVVFFVDQNCVFNIKIYKL